jgi:predicted small integral membrane protein
MVMTGWWPSREARAHALDAAVGTAVAALTLAVVLWLAAALVVGSAVILHRLGEAF